MSAPVAASERGVPGGMRRGRFSLAVSAALALLLALMLGDVMLGPQEVSIPPVEVGRVLIQHLPLLDRLPVAAPSDTHDRIVWNIRLPRAVVGALIGALLGLAGVALQGLLMNPLADPYTVGVSSGAAVGASLAEVLGLSALWMGYGVVAVAFAGALGAVAVVYALARVHGRISVHTFLLAGVVVGTLLWSLIPLFLFLAQRQTDLARILFYLIGSIQSADWTRAALLLPFLIGVGALLQRWSRDLNLMSLGEETAAHLGVEIEPFKRRILLVSSLATAAAVSVAGIIGFVGLVVPHLARRIVGPDHRALLPLAALFGASLLVASDLLVRVFLNEMPVGVVTSLVGAPVFCLLLRRRRAVAW